MGHFGSWWQPRVLVFVALLHDGFLSPSRVEAASEASATTAENLLQRVRIDAGVDPAAAELQRMRDEQDNLNGDSSSNQRIGGNDGDGAVEEDFYGFATPRLYFETMLTFHCEGGNEKQYRAHIDAGINIDARNRDDGETCLIKAARQGHVDIVKDALEEQGAFLNAVADDGTTALIAASEAGQVDVVRILLRASGAKAKKKPPSKGKKSNARKHRGHRQREKIRFAVTHSKQWSAIMAAIEGTGSAEDKAAIVHLLGRGGSPHVNRKSSQGLAPAHLAAREGLVGVLQALVKHGCDLNARAGIEASEGAKAEAQPQDQLSTWEQRRQKQIARIVSHETTPLLLALEKRQTAAVHYILFDAEHDAPSPPAVDDNETCTEDNGGARSRTTPIDVSVADAHGVTPLMAASVVGNVSVIQRLIDLGANVNAQAGEGRDTALLRASFFGHTEVVEVLLTKGKALVNLPDAQQTTPLMKASWYNHADVVRLLLKHGAAPSLHRQSVHGATALSKAAEWGHSEVVAVLQAAQAAFDAEDPLADRRNERKKARERQQAKVQPAAEPDGPTHSEL